LGREVSQAVGEVRLPEGTDTLVLGDPREAIDNTLERFVESSSLEHLILVLDNLEEQQKEPKKIAGSE
jgi:hypothetical protein